MESFYDQMNQQEAESPTLEGKQQANMWKEIAKGELMKLGVEKSEPVEPVSEQPQQSEQAAEESKVSPQMSDAGLRIDQDTHAVEEVKQTVQSI